MGYGIGIGMGVLARRHPRLAVWLAIVFALLFAIYAVGLGIASAFKYDDAQRWSRDLQCHWSCWNPRNVAATR